MFFTIFNPRYVELFGRKPRVIPTFGIRIKESLEELDFDPDIIAKFEFPETPPWTYLGNIVKRNWDILDKSSSTREVINWKVTQGIRRPKNIRDLIVRALVKNPLDVQVMHHPERNYKRATCSRNNCRYCIKLDKSGSIRSPITGRKYNTIRSCSCKTNNIIYCITCQVCFKQYIGHTKRTLGERMCEHFRYITQHNSTHCRPTL